MSLEAAGENHCVGCGGRLRPVPARAGLLEHWRCKECGAVWAWEPLPPFTPGHQASFLNEPGQCWRLCEAPEAHLAEYAVREPRPIPREDEPLYLKPQFDSAEGIKP